MNRFKKKLLACTVMLFLGVFLITSINVEQVQAAKKVKVTSVAAKYCSTGKVTLIKGKKYSLGAYVTPTNASNKKLSYKSSKKSVATVNSKGKITAKKVGTTKITITAKDRSKKKKVITVKVVAKKNFKKANKISFAKSTYNVVVGKKVSTKVNFNSSNVSNKNLKYSSSKTSIATVDEKGVVTAKKAGTVKITATTLDGSKKKATTTVKVSVLASKITISGSSSVDLNKTTKLVANVSPSNTTNKNVTWSSSDRSIATVNSKGVVTPKKIGTVKITAKTKDGSNKSATKSITVKPVYFNVSFNTNGGEAIDTQSVLYNTTAYKPEAPLKQGYVFQNWYTNSACTTVYNFSTKVTKNITLYAKYVPLNVSINIVADTNDESVVERNLTTTVTSNAIIENVEYLLKTETNNEKESSELELVSNKNETHINLEDGNNTFEIVVTTNEGSKITKSITMNYDRGIVVDTLEKSEYAWGTIDESDVAAASEMSLNLADDEMLITSQPAISVASEVEAQSTETSGEQYVKNMLMVYFDSEVTKARREQIAEEIGEKVGYLNTVSMYQIKLDQEYTYDELLDLGEEYENEYAGEVVGCSIECATESDISASAYTPNDPATDNGLWWQDRIDLKAAWGYRDVTNIEYLSKVKLGVVDSGFETSHSDLANKITVIKGDNSKESHGTHVAGIMAAEMDNSIGFAGIVDNTELLAVDAIKSGKKYFTDSLITDGIVKLVEEGAKVVNLSLGSSGSLDTNADYKRERKINSEGKKASRILGKLLERQYDCIIVQSAGNGAGDGIGVDAINNGNFCSITEENCYSSRKVSTEDIMNRVFVVANAKNDDVLSTSSNGGSQVNIAAPGSNIYSTILNNSYGNMSGTSMAAPIVSGVCGLVWSANPALTGAEVVDIVKNNTSGTASDNTSSTNTAGSYGIVNAELAVEAAVNELPTVVGKFVNASTGDGMKATYKIHKYNGMNIANHNMDTEIIGSGTMGTSTSSNGQFELPKLPYGLYVLEVSADNFVTNYFTFAVPKEFKGSEIDLDMLPLSKQLSGNTYRIVLKWGETPRDLDSHFRATSLTGDDIHVYYSRKNSDFADLDVDDVSSYGPETITIYDISKVANVKYAVHNYTNRSATAGTSKASNLANSGAYVQVYRGNDLVKTFKVPAGEGTVWTVFAINSDGTITGINSLEFERYPSDVLSSGISNQGSKGEALEEKEELKEYELAE